MVQDEIQLMKNGKYATSNVSHSLYSQLTTADVTFPHNGTEILFVCGLLHMSFCIISGHEMALVWEKRSGGKKKDFWELRAKNGKGQKHRDEK